MTWLLLLALALVFPVLLAVAPWVLAALTIIFGDKESLHYFGNLCDKPLPPVQYGWKQDPLPGRLPPRQGLRSVDRNW